MRFNDIIRNIVSESAGVVRNFKKSSTRWGHARSACLHAALGGLLLFASCSDEALVDNTPTTGTASGFTGTTDAVLLAINLNLPSTRSETTSDGGSNGHQTGTDSNGDPTYGGETDNGETNESSMNGFVLNFYDENGKRLELENSNGLKYNGSSFYGTADGSSIIIEVPVNFVKDQLAGKKIYVRVGLNMGNGVEATEVNTTFGYQLNDFEEDGLAVPMANYDKYEIDFTQLRPTSPTFMQDLFALLDPDRIFHVSIDKTGENNVTLWTGSDFLDLERGVARVDFKPTRVMGPDGRNYLPYSTYQVGIIPNLYVQLTNMQIFNVKKDAYMFRHTSVGNSTEGGNESTLFGFENDGYGDPVFDDLDPDIVTGYKTEFTWVKDTDWTEKTGFLTASKNTTTPWTGPSSDGDPYFENQPILGRDGIYRISETTGKYEISSMTQGNWNSLCYITENTLPSVEAMIKGLSTGIAFNMFICDKEGNPITTSDINDHFISQSAFDTQMQDLVDEKARLEREKDNEEQPPTAARLAEINNRLTAIEADKADLEKKIIGSCKQKMNGTNEVSGVYELQIGSQTVDCLVSTVKVTETQGTETSVKNVQNALVMTYYYMFRHNIDEKHVVGTVRPMQFAVVRNNIYRVSITGLNSLPEPYDPSDPDEPEDNYISIETAILSWARVDNDDVNL